MKKENQKASDVVNVVELSPARVEYIDNAIGYQLDINDMDTIYNKDRASLKKLLLENVALAMGNEPTYKEWNYIHELFRDGTCKETGMDIVSFDKNIWSDIVYHLKETYALEKPKSPNVKSEQKSEQRQKIEAMTDAELKAQGKIVELAKREEKRLKNAEKLEKDSKKELSKKIKDNHNKLIENEFAFACWIDNNTNMLREQFLDSQS
jgi:hypothetical protein